jgi:hypothetical protein
MGKEGPGRGEPIGPLDWLRLLPHEAAASSSPNQTTSPRRARRSLSRLKTP